MLIDRLKAALRASQRDDFAKSFRIQTKSPTSDHWASYLAILTAIEGGDSSKG